MNECNARQYNILFILVYNFTAWHLFVKRYFLICLNFKTLTGRNPSTYFQCLPTQIIKVIKKWSKSTLFCIQLGYRTYIVSINIFINNWFNYMYSRNAGSSNFLSVVHGYYFKDNCQFLSRFPLLLMMNLNFVNTYDYVASLIITLKPRNVWHHDQLHFFLYMSRYTSHLSLFDIRKMLHIISNLLTKFNTFKNDT